MHTVHPLYNTVVYMPCVQIYYTTVVIALYSTFPWTSSFDPSLLDLPPSPLCRYIINRSRLQNTPLPVFWRQVASQPSTNSSCSVARQRLTHQSPALLAYAHRCKTRDIPPLANPGCGAFYNGIIGVSISEVHG